MRHILYILALGIALCLTGCAGSWGDSDADPTLDYVDSLMDASQYREAYNVLAVADSAMRSKSRGVQMRYQLQKIKVEDKLYIKHNNDSTILALVNYYEEEGNRLLLNEAYYYAGSIYRDLQDASRALEYYQKALSGSSDNDLMLKEKINSQMGYLLSSQMIYDEAIRYHDSAKELAARLKDTLGLIYSNNDIATIYRHKKSYDLAFFYFDKAEELSLQYKAANTSCLIYSQKAATYNETGNYQLAEKYLNLSLTDLAPSDTNSVYAIAGNIYFKQHKYEAASFYYHELLNSNDIYSRQLARAMLLSIAANEGDFSEALKHLVPYKNLTDSIVSLMDSEKLARINSLYNSRQLEKQKEVLEKKNDRNTFLIIIGGFLLLSIIAFSSTYTYRVHSERNRLRYNNAMLDQYLKDEQQKRELAEQERLRIQAERDKLAEDHMQEQHKLVLGDERKAIIQESELYQKLYNSGKVISVKDLEDVKVLLDEVYPEFFFRLHSIGVIKDQEIKVSMLLKMGFAPSKIASLLSLSLSAVSNIRKRTYEKVTGKVGKADDWDKIIMNM